MEEIERRRSERKYRNRLPPLPENLRRLRESVGEGKKVARFYALYTDLFGNTRRVSFGVKVNKRIPNRALAFLIRTTVGEMKNNRIPEVASGEVLSDFVHDLYTRNWEKSRRLLDYKAGVVYAR
jgi:hypothetical protein